jgi:hypothetical protein
LLLSFLFLWWSLLPWWEWWWCWWWLWWYSCCCWSYVKKLKKEINKRRSKILLWHNPVFLSYARYINFTTRKGR